MSPAQTPKVGAFIPTALLLSLIGWGGLALLLNFTLPTLFPRWLLYFLALCAMTGLALPISAYLNNRFPSDPPARVQVILREALWVGAFAATLLWLQFGRVLSLALGVFFALIFTLFEALLRLREGNRWSP